MNGNYKHDDIKSDDTKWNSFVTSTSLLPPFGQKMRAYGSSHQYTVGFLFQLPTEINKFAVPVLISKFLDQFDYKSHQKF